MCHPGLPGPHGLSQLGSPSLAACNYYHENEMSNIPIITENMLTKLARVLAPSTVQNQLGDAFLSRQQLVPQL